MLVKKPGVGGFPIWPATYYKGKGMGCLSMAMGQPDKISIQGGSLSGQKAHQPTGKMPWMPDGQSVPVLKTTYAGSHNAPRFTFGLHPLIHNLHVT